MSRKFLGSSYTVCYYGAPQYLVGGDPRELGETPRELLWGTSREVFGELLGDILESSCGNSWAATACYYRGPRELVWELLHIAKQPVMLQT